MTIKIRDCFNPHHGDMEAVIVQRDDEIARLRALIKDIPPGTLEAIKAGTMVIVPKHALDWLNGEIGLFVPPHNASGNYWWRSEFARRCKLSAAPRKPEGT